MIVNPFKILSVFFSLTLCFTVYIGLSDESPSHNLPHLFLMSSVFASSLFYETIYKKFDSFTSWKKSSILVYVLGASISVACLIFLIYLKRFDLLSYNEPYSFGRFIYVFGVVAAGCLITSLLMIFISRQKIREA
jgi:hypothetical protein